MVQGDRFTKDWLIRNEQIIYYLIIGLDLTLMGVYIFLAIVGNKYMYYLVLPCFLLGVISFVFLYFAYSRFSNQIH